MESLKTRMPAFLCGLLALTLILSVDISRVMTFAPIVIGCVFFLLYFFATQKWSPVPREALIAVFGILALSTLSLLWAAHLEESFRKVVQLWLLLLPMTAFLAVLAAQDAQNIRPYSAFITWAAVVAWVYMVFELATGGALAHSIKGGEDLPDYHFNRSVMALMAPSFAALYLFPRRYMALLILIPMGVAAMLTSSQSAQVSFVLGTFLFGVGPYLPLRHVWFWRTGVGILITGLIAMPFVAPYAFAHYASFLASIGWMAEGAAPQRLELWDYVARYALQSPWVGYGIEATRAINDFDSARVFDRAGVTIHPHCAFLQIWIEFGLIGIIVVSCGLWALAKWIHQVCAKDPVGEIFLPALVAGLGVPLLLTFGMWQSWFIGMIYFTMGLVILAVRARRSDPWA